MISLIQTVRATRISSGSGGGSGGGGSSKTAASTAPPLRSRNASEDALGLKPSVVWPADTASLFETDSAPVETGVVVYRTQPVTRAHKHAIMFLETGSGRRSGSLIEAVAPPSPPPPPACLGGCNQRGVCFEGKCFCDPGWDGADCNVAKACQAGCEEHGVCVYGIC
jgi:hypothetical protein